MNCKQGDLAIIVSDYFKENIGRLVRIVTSATEDNYGFLDSFHWECDPLGGGLFGFSGNDDGTYFIGTGYTAVRDSDLRPIKDQDGEDETFSWAGKPEVINASR